jgi:hypothetical protein
VNVNCKFNVECDSIWGQEGGIMMRKEKGEQDEAGTRGKKKGVDGENGTSDRRTAGVGSGE